MNRDTLKNDKYEFLIGRYDYKWLCMPEWNPWGSLDKKRKPPPFYGVNEAISLCVALIMGLQHCLAMVGGILAYPIAIGNTSGNNSITQYLISANLIVCGITTFFHVLQFKIPFTKYYWGTALISVCGSSGSSFLNTMINGIGLLQAEGFTWEEAYGKMMGTACVCAFTMIFISFLPPKVLARIFPPAICGIGLLLSGIAIIANGVKLWGGGSDCGNSAMLGGVPGTKISQCLVPTSAPHTVSPGGYECAAGTFQGANGTYWKLGTCYNPIGPALCASSGDDGGVVLKFGSAPYIALGTLVFFGLIICETFGSPFMRSASVAIALLFGYMISAVITTDGHRYVNSTKLNDSSIFTFLWTKNFPLGFYVPAILPFCVLYCVMTVSGIGDITATEEASRVEYTGPLHDRRIQGGMLADGFNSVFSCLAYAGPMGIYAQNNGVIPFTRCANRSAGFACAFWLFLFGVVAKVGAFFNSIPACVMGGMTTFVYAAVGVSGLKLIAMDTLGRRMRLILSLTFAVAVGVGLVPAAVTYNFWPVHPGMSSGMKALHDSVILVLTSPQTVGCLMAIGLNLTLPIDDDSDEVELERDRLQKMLSIGVKGRHLPTDIEMNPGVVTAEHTQKFTPESFKDTSADDSSNANSSPR